MTLEILISDLLSPLRHGFFTRKGGASSGVLRGLNCGYGSSDQAEIVSANRARAATAMQVAPGRMVTVDQVHSADVVRVGAPLAPPLPRADAMVTATPGLALCILTADCQPVLLADHENGVIGAAHAGWRGALGGILEAVVAAMEALGADRRRISAVIGPAISQTAYEVGPEFLSAFLEADPDNRRFFTGGAGDRLHFDLPGFGLSRLCGVGVGRAVWTGHCTCSDPERFYSCRRAVHRGEADYGRLLSAIRL